jgi:hypothetical protein
VWKVEAGERRIDAVEMVRWCRGCGREPMESFKRLVALVPAQGRAG